MNTGFIGAGNMAGALIRGFVKAGISADTIYAYNRSPQKAESLKKECNINFAASYKDILDNCRIVVLAVKPHLMAGMLNDIKKDLDKSRHVLLSIAAGTSLDMLTKFAGVKGMPVIRVMPNVNVSVGEGVTALCRNEFVQDADYEYAMTLFSGVGKAVEIEERMFPIFGALAGSSPAFSYYFIEALARAAHKAGMPKSMALEIAAQAVSGSAKMFLSANKHPWELIDMVCSPGGTTIEGISALEEYGFSTAVCKCLDACMEKDRVIQEKNSK
ncbi:MAG: pyrroline-5-carboxylate reductase [Clostridiales bacterium]|jgi:pyrroline-5-carboxylate reductase|nr:pyrroline-5-carboxylate reductase [Clostridiales bacterium]